MRVGTQIIVLKTHLDTDDSSWLVKLHIPRAPRFRLLMRISTNLKLEYVLIMFFGPNHSIRHAYDHGRCSG